MKTKTAFLAFLFPLTLCLFAGAAIPTATIESDLLTVKTADGKKELRTILVDGARVSENCKNHDCDALKAAELPKKAAFNDLTSEEDENTYCLQVGGKVVMTRLSSGTPMGFCEFKDGSSISSWYLIN